MNRRIGFGCGEWKHHAPSAVTEHFLKTLPQNSREDIGLDMGITEVQNGKPLGIGMVPFQEKGFYRIPLKKLNGI